MNIFEVFSAYYKGQFNIDYYTEKLFIAKYVLFYNNNSKKYQESRENQSAMVIIPS